MGNIGTQNSLMEHSAAKVRLLSKYLTRYLRIISNDRYTKRIGIFDLFCGEGKYQGGGEGSPLVILRSIKSLLFYKAQTITLMPKLDCRFNDIDATKIQKLKNSIVELKLGYENFGEIEFSSKKYSDLYTEITEHLMNQKNKGEKFFIFIDPFGYKHIRISQIKDMLKFRNAEVLLWLPTQFMYRFSSNGTPESLVDFIDEMNILHEIKQDINVWKFITLVKTGMKNILGGEYFVDTFTIQKDPNTVYCLFFFTSHIKGFEKMLEAKWEIDSEEGRGWRFDANSPTLFSGQKINELEEKLRHFLSLERTNKEIYLFVLNESFRPKHANEILSAWQEKGQLEVTSIDGERIRKKSFYISYEHYQKNGKTVKIKLK